MNRRFALIQALVSLVALAAVVWWAAKQEPPEFPSGGEAIAWLVAARSLLYARRDAHSRRALAPDPRAPPACARARGDCYALTTVGYMGNNVLPARAGEALQGRAALADAATRASARCSARSSPSASST